MNSTQWLSLITMGLDASAGAVMFFVFLSERNRLLAPLGYRLGLAFAICGMVGQIMWSWYVVLTGHFPEAGFAPWWLGKDLGFFVLGMTYMVHHIRHGDGREDVHEVEKKSV